MPTLPTRSFSAIVANTVAGIQGRASVLIDFGQGSPLRAIVEAFAGLFMWFQALALQILAASRLSTSTGNDVDTFTADFMPPLSGSASPRLGAQAAAGLLKFSRFTAGPSACFIPVGATVQSADGSQNFVVTADPMLPTYSASAGGYTLAANLPSIIVPAAAQVAGLAGNVQAGAISVITSPLTGIDTASNPAAFVGGADQESDSALKKRFVAYILGLSRGDYYGTAAAVLGAEINLQWQLIENYNVDGSWRPGFYFIVGDDGSGAPSAAFIQAIQDAAYSVRPLGIQCAVVRPAVAWASPSLSITTAPGYDHNTVVGLVANAVADGINSLGLGVDLDFNRITTWAYSVAGVTKVSGLLLNGMSGDAASMSAAVVTQNGLFKMRIVTIKCQTCVVS